MSVPAYDVKHHAELTGCATGLKPELYVKFKIAEELAHGHAYDAKLKTDVIIPISVPDVSKPGHLKAENHSVYQFMTNHSGLIGFLLFPLEFSKENENSINIKIIFRGTDPFNWASVQRDVTEEGGAGHQSYHANKKAIISQINAGIQHLFTTLAKNGVDTSLLELSLTIAGHSLGGADAQRCFLSLIASIARNLGISEAVVKTGDCVEPQHRNYLNSIRKLCLHTFNSTGISKDDNHQAEQIAAFLANKTISKSLLDLEVNIFYADGDGVQQTGDTHLLHRVPAYQANVRLIVASNQYKGSHFVTKADVKNTATNLIGKKLGEKAVEYLLMGAVVSTGLYTFGLGSAWYYGLYRSSMSAMWSVGVGAVTAAIPKLSDWYETARISYSLGAGLKGTIKAHTTFYFKDDYTVLKTKKEMDLYFLSIDNKEATGQAHIMKEVGQKCGLTNTVHAVYAKSRSTICESFFCRKKSSEVESAAGQTISVQYNPNVSNLYLFQALVKQAKAQAAHAQALAAAQAAQAHAAAAFTQRVMSLHQGGFL